MQVTGEALFYLLGFGFGAGEPEEVVIGVPAIPQPPVAGIEGIPAGQRPSPLAGFAHDRTVTSPAATFDHPR